LRKSLVACAATSSSSKCLKRSWYACLTAKSCVEPRVHAISTNTRFPGGLVGEHRVTLRRVPDPRGGAWRRGGARCSHRPATSSAMKRSRGTKGRARAGGGRGDGRESDAEPRRSVPNLKHRMLIKWCKKADTLRVEQGSNEN
jgi:hypothetical protein